MVGLRKAAQALFMLAIFSRYWLNMTSEKRIKGLLNIEQGTAELRRGTLRHSIFCGSEKAW
jgi:hypothetical protein